MVFAENFPELADFVGSYVQKRITAGCLSKPKVIDILDLEVSCANAMWLLGYQEAVKTIRFKLGFDK